MRVSGYLLPFPDPGAADLMSDHLEQDVHAAGPGTLRLRVSLPGTRFDAAGSPAQTGTRFARTKLEVLQEAADGWAVLWSATSDGVGSSKFLGWTAPTTVHPNVSAK